MLAAKSAEFARDLAVMGQSIHQMQLQREQNRKKQTGSNKNLKLDKISSFESLNQSRANK